jgi:hypothetical protein
LLAGLIITVRFVPEPPKTIFATGTRLVFDELAVMTKLVAAVSASPIVKAKAEVELFALMVWSVTSLMVGGVFGGAITVKTKLSLL